jgi:hypothetical protein
MIIFADIGQDDSQFIVTMNREPWCGEHNTYIIHLLRSLRRSSLSLGWHFIFLRVSYPLIQRLINDTVSTANVTYRPPDIKKQCHTWEIYDEQQLSLKKGINHRKIRKYHADKMCEYTWNYKTTGPTITEP